MCRVSFLHSSHVAKQYIDSIWDQETNCMHTLMMIIATETSPKDARGRGRETIMQHIVASSVWNCMGINSEEKLCYKMCWGSKWQSEFIHNVAQKYMYRPWLFILFCGLRPFPHLPLLQFLIICNTFLQIKEIKSWSHWEWWCLGHWLWCKL